MKSLLRQFINRLAGSRRGLNSIFRFLKTRDTRFYSQMDDVAFVYDPSEFIGRHIFEHGHFQRNEIETVAKHAETQARGRDVMLEIGANIGTTTVYAAKTGIFRRIIAVEADPNNFELLLANIRLNGLIDIVTPICCAASNQAGTATLRRNLLHSGMSTIEPVDTYFRTDTVGSAVEVPIRTADEILAEAGISPDEVALVWMDIEGHEPKALRGMERILDATPPLYFEYAPIRYSDDEVAWVEKNVLKRYRTTRMFSDDWHDIPAEGIRALGTSNHMNLFSYGQSG